MGNNINTTRDHCDVSMVPLHLDNTQMNSISFTLDVQEKSLLESCYIQQYPDTYLDWAVESIGALRYPNSGHLPTDRFFKSLSESNKADYNFVMNSIRMQGSRAALAVLNHEYTLAQLQKITAIMKRFDFQPDFILRSNISLDKLLKVRDLLIDYWIANGPIKAHYSHGWGRSFSFWHSPVYTYQWDGQQYKYSGVE